MVNINKRINNYNSISIIIYYNNINNNNYYLS